MRLCGSLQRPPATGVGFDARSAEKRALLVRLQPLARHRHFLSVSLLTSNRSAGDWSFNITSSISVNVDQAPSL